MTREKGPAAARLRLKRELAERFGDKSGSRVARQLGWPQSKISRILSGEQRIQPHEVEQLLEVLGVEDHETVGKLKELAVQALARGWWQQPGSGVPPALRPFVEILSAAAEVNWFEPTLFPALVQTEDYARALIRCLAPAISEAELEQRIKARLTMQSLLTSDDPLRAHVILDSAVLRRVIGGREVFIRQLQHVLDLTNLSNLTLQVVTRPEHPGLTGWFSVMYLENGDDTAYVDGQGGSIYLEDPTEIRSLSVKFGQLSALSLSPAQSADLVHETIATLEGGSHEA